MKFAFYFGADAVYIGGENFSLRAGAKNFGIDKIREGVEFAHSIGKKVYLATNIFFRNHHIEKFKSFLEQIKSIPIDALIVSDLGAISIIAEEYPQFDLHISTQANTTNYETVRFYQKLGVKRIILARELSIEEIKEIKDKVPEMELEIFVHGAMCMAYSGRCLLSAFLTSSKLGMENEKFESKRKETRDANLGDCSHTCRWQYSLIEESRPSHKFPVEETVEGTYILSSKDLFLLPYIDKLIEAGISSIKIEGRMKSIYYIANVTRCYRYVIDNFYKTGDFEIPGIVYEELDKVSHREYTSGFTFETKDALKPNQTTYLRNYRFLGYVCGILEKDGQKYYEINLFNQIKADDKIEIIGYDEMKCFSNFDFKLYNENFEEVFLLNHTEKLYIVVDLPLKENYILRKIADF